MKSLKNILSGVIGIAILLLMSPCILAQSKARVEHVDFFPNGSELIITYEIIKHKPNETFKVWVNVYSETGVKIIPKTLTGDVGNNIMGGKYKRIIWDMEADQAFLNEEIAVVVLAESELYSNEGKTDNAKQITKEEPVKEKNNVKKEGISVGGALGLSLVLPGLGRRVATGTGFAYLWGVAGYGCLAGAYFMNNSAYNNYEEYKTAASSSERDDLYKKAKNQDLYSKVFLGGAAAIWVVNLITTGVKAGQLRKSGYDQRLSFTADFDPYIQQPLIGLKYRF